MGQVMTTGRFYFHGKSHFTQTGWLQASARYPKPDPLETIDLADRVFVVTGANSGCGFEATQYLASKKGKVYMVCRNKERGEKARQEIADKTGSSNLHLLIGDCGVKADVRRIAQEIRGRESNLDCLLCNAGALLNKRETTADGLEVTFATHLAMGTYLLGECLKPLLGAASDGGRIVVVSSGGMYNVKYDHKAAMSEGSLASSYNGQMAYAYAKRGQVLLCERWAKEIKGNTTFVSCHPGWTDTPGVEQAYGSQKSWLQPLRTLWQGTEGICWLCSTPKSELQNGAFYLDRSPQEFHLGDTSRTKNTQKEIDNMVAELSKITGEPDATLQGA